MCIPHAHTHKHTLSSNFVLFCAELTVNFYISGVLIYLEVTKDHKSYKHIPRNTCWCVMWVLRWDSAQMLGLNNGVEKLNGAPNTKEDEHNGNKGELPICLPH